LPLGRELNAKERRAHAWSVLPNLHPVTEAAEVAGKALSSAFWHAPSLCKIRESGDKWIEIWASDFWPWPAGVARPLPDRAAPARR